MRKSKEVVIFKLVVIIAIVVGSFAAYSQGLEISEEYNVTRSKGDDLYPSWSSDGTKIVFQSDRNGNWDIFEYDLTLDTVIQHTTETYNQYYPSLVADQKELSYTIDKAGYPELISGKLPGGGETKIIDRNFNCKAATFPSSGYLFYCLGYDELSKKWALYRYEFKYKSLKKIVDPGIDDFLPQVTDDGEFILYLDKTGERNERQLNVMNWYGKMISSISGYNITDPSWVAGGLKIIFVSDKDEKSGEIYSVWKDGSHLERWTFDQLFVRNPVVSPDGTMLAVSALVNDNYDLFVLPLDDY